HSQCSHHPHQKRLICSLEAVVRPFFPVLIRFHRRAQTFIHLFNYSPFSANKCRLCKRRAFCLILNCDICYRCFPLTWSGLAEVDYCLVRCSRISPSHFFCADLM
uniref:Uncharacterized protein n=1 Tax=Parascaris univalens TaxID=6257 RepID=A0A915BFX5_PARUN